MGSPTGGVFRTGQVLDFSAGLCLLLLSTLFPTNFVPVCTYWLSKGMFWGSHTVGFIQEPVRIKRVSSTRVTAELTSLSVGNCWSESVGSPSCNGVNVSGPCTHSRPLLRM